MKDYDELISSFDDIQDLPVSEEMLGAYLEGNLSMHEIEEMGAVLDHDMMLQSLIGDIAMDFTGDFNDSIGALTFQTEYDVDVVEAQPDYSFSFADDMDQDPNIDAAFTDITLDDPTTDIAALDDLSTDFYSPDHDSGIDDPSFDLPDIPLF